MKREGRQHGMVRTYRVLPTPLNPRPETRFDSPTTAGLFARVSPRPNNHSKFTGKCCGHPRCNGCHFSPACKARDKAKGTHKARSSDVVSNYRLVTWRVVDARPGISLSGSSATMILDHLYSTYDRDDDDDDEEVDGDDRDDDPTVEIEVDPVEAIKGGDVVVDHDDHEEMSFCAVGFVLEQVEGDDGWCLVGEM